MAAREHRPDHAAQSDVDTARTERAFRRLIHFRQRGVGRIGARIDADDIAGLVDAGEAAVHRLAPDGIVDRARHDAVERSGNALVLGRIDGVFRADIGIALAVAVGVDDERSPTLRGDAVMCLAELFGVEPADDAAAKAWTARAHP